MTQVRLEPTAPRSRVKHSTTEPLRSQLQLLFHTYFECVLSRNIQKWDRIIQGCGNCKIFYLSAKMYLSIENLLVQKNKLAYILQCLNNLFFQKQYETRYISTLANSMDPDQLATLVNRVDPDQLASSADQEPHCFQCKM